MYYVAYCAYRNENWAIGPRSTEGREGDDSRGHRKIVYGIL